ncbi:MAG: pantothenate kinase [Bacteroidales bacterium]
MIVIGIDIGSTTTKSVAIYPDKSFKTLTTRAFDAITSATGALGKMLMENHLEISSIRSIVLTGAGASGIEGNLFGIDTHKIDELQAIGLGGMYLSGQSGLLITNIGTGTALVEAYPDQITHIGGTAVGGGTILGLAKAMLKTSEVQTIFEMAAKGRISQVDLLIGDIVDDDLGFLKKEMTASNFGKMLESARDEDIALGILTMVYQVIGTVSSFAARSRNISQVVVTGSASNESIGKRILEGIGNLYDIRFIYPEHAAYATAIGAALSRANG